MFPETLEVLTNGFDAERHSVRELVGPADPRDQIDGVAVLGHRLLKQHVARGEFLELTVVILILLEIILLVH